VVLEQGSTAPIEGAIVSLQATPNRTTTAADGSFSLDVPPGTDLVIVAAKKGYFNQSAVVTPPVADTQIELQAVLQENDPDYELVIPDECGSCHPDQLEQWTGSPMAKAGPNTWVHDIYDGTGTTGGMGGFVYTRDSVFADTNPNSECASCHQPEVWIAEPFAAMIGPDEPPSVAAMHGVSCESCHKVADVDVRDINYPGLFFPDAMTLTRPSNLFDNQVMYGVLGDSEFHLPGSMRASYQPQLVAELCGLCHQDKNDLEEDHSFTGVTSEPTYTEWAESPYGDINSVHYQTCVDCHMPPTGATQICVLDPVERDPETIRSHEVLGTTPEYLENAADLVMTTEVVGNEVSVEIDVVNSLTGHHVPTGVTVRNMILVVEAWRDGDDPLTDPLTSTGSQVIHDLGGVGDPAEGYYAGLPGKFFAKVNHDANGNGPTFFTDATGIQFDSRIPALETDSTQYSFLLPAEDSLVRVRARLIYRRGFRFLVDAKGWTQDGHGNPLADVAAPHYGHLMESEEAIIVVGQGTGACCHEDATCTQEADAESCAGTFLGVGIPCDPLTCDATGGFCGDGILDPGEECDDGNNMNGDGCDEHCRLEPPMVPATSTWGALAIVMLLLAAGTLSILRRKQRVS
jgi:cysteine-rich repeat protein